MPVYLRGKIPAHPLQGPTVRRVRLALGYSLSGFAIALGLSERWGKRHVTRLQANQRCASGALARRFAEVTGEPLPLPERVHPRILPPPTRAEKRAIREAPARYRWVWEGVSYYRERV
jgi:hypothetical protein